MFQPHLVDIQVFAQPFNIGLGSEDLVQFFTILSDDMINKKQAFESDNAQIIELSWNKYYWKIAFMMIFTRFIQFAALVNVWYERTP